jgi:hypothetical protein
VTEKPFSFGGEHRYYGSRTATGEIAALLKEYDPELERRVSRSFRQWNNVLRDQLRNEMGLRLSIGDETQAVPVRVVPGFPAPFQNVFEGIPPGLWRFLLRLPALEATVKGLDSVRRPFINRKLIARHNTFFMLTAEEQPYSHVANFCWFDETGRVRNDWEGFSKENVLASVR